MMEVQVSAYFVTWELTNIFNRDLHVGIVTATEQSVDLKLGRIIFKNIVFEPM